MIAKHVAVVNKHKTMTKKTKPVFVVNLTEVESCDDIKFEFTMAKIRAKKPISIEDAENLVRYGSKLTMECIDEAIDNLLAQQEIVKLNGDDAKKVVSCIEDIVYKKKDEEKPKKDPWYKRFWNWFKKPFTKK